MTKIHSKNSTRTSYILLRVIYKFFEVDKKSRFYGTDKPLFEAEIHMIKSIKENEGIHVTGLAEKLGITKGAVSQTIAKLQKKGMVIKDRDSSNQSKLVLRLTEKGEIAYKSHIDYHEKFDKCVENILKDTTEDNKIFLKKFLLAVEKAIDAYNE
jgi:DNA-binding MarR family transcriptional regulator